MRYQTIEYTDSIRHTFTFRVVDPKWLNLNPNKRTAQYQYPDSQRWELLVEHRGNGIKYIPNTFVKDNTVLYDEWYEYCRSVNPDTDSTTTQMFHCVPRVWSDNLAGITQLACEYYNTYGDKNIEIIDRLSPFSTYGGSDYINGETVWKPTHCGLKNKFSIYDIADQSMFDYRDPAQLGKVLEKTAQEARQSCIEDIDNWVTQIKKLTIKEPA